MEVLNRSFKPVGISFKLAGVDWTAISTLAPYENPFSKILYNKELQGIYKGDDKGDNTTLNLYFLNGTNGHGGISQNLFYLKRSVFVNARTVPGGTEPSFNMGLTTVHEVGHWLGLVDIYKVKPSWGSEEDFSKARAACLKLEYGVIPRCQPVFATARNANKKQWPLRYPGRVPQLHELCLRVSWAT